MIAPVRTAYAQRVAGSRLAAGARNVAKMAESPEIETLTESKRTGAQEESLLREGTDRAEVADAAGLAGQPVRGANHESSFDSALSQSLRLDQKLRAALEAYRYTLDKLDPDNERHRPGNIYDAPL